MRQINRGETIKFSKKEIKKNIYLCLIVMVIIILLSLLASRFGRNIYDYVYNSVSETIASSLAGQTLTEYIVSVEDGAKIVREVLEDKIYPFIKKFYKTTPN